MTNDDPPLAYEIHGTGTPVVFLHGLTFDRGTWRPIVDRLGDDVQSIAFDLPGHGETGGELPRTLAEVAETVDGSLTALGVKEPIVVGHSISAVIALHYAASHPARGIVDVGQRLSPRPFAELVQRLEPELRGDDFRAAFAPFQDGMGLERLDEATRARILATQTIDRELVLAYWGELLRTEPARSQAGLEEVMSAVRAPFLGVFGHELAPAERRHLLAHLPGAELEEWPGDGHHVHLAEPDRFTARLRESVASTA